MEHRFGPLDRSDHMFSHVTRGTGYVKDQNAPGSDTDPEPPALRSPFGAPVGG